MKTLFLFLTLLCMGTAMIARTQTPSMRFAEKICKQLNQKNSITRTRAIKQRLILDSSFTKTPIVFTWMNSNSYKYNGQRGSYQYMMFNNIYHDCYGDSLYYLENNGGMVDQTKTIVKYNALDAYTDFLELNFNQVTQVYDSTFRASITYNGQNLVQEILFEEYNGPGWTSSDKTIYLYNGQNQLTKTIELTFNGIGFDSSGMTTNTYIAGNQTESLYQSYDINNQTWHNESQDLYTYNAQNKMITWANNSGWTGVTYDYHLMQYYLLDIADRKDSSFTTSWMTGVPVDTNNYYKYQYNGNDTFFSSVMQYDNLKNKQLRIENTFDANKNLLVSKQYEYAFADSFRSYTNYYYENYNTGTDVDDHDIASHLTVYPNPVGQTVFVDFYMTQNELVNAEICDMSGRRILHFSEAGFIGQHFMQLPVSDLFPGLYCLNLRGEKAAIKSVKLIKN